MTKSKQIWKRHLKLLVTILTILLLSSAVTGIILATSVEHMVALECLIFENITQIYTI